MSGYVITTHNGDELYHHGIKGMHWGIRNYQNMDGSLTPLGRQRYGRAAERHEAKGDRARTRLGKAYHYSNAAEARYKLKRSQNIQKAVGFRQHMSEAYGHGNAATYYHEMNKAHSKMAEYARSKGKRGERKWSEAKEFNTKQLEKYHKEARGRSIVGNMKAYLNMPVQHLSGRRTTRGKDILNNMFMSGAIGIYLDNQHVKNNKKVAKATYKSEMAKAKAAYKSGAKGSLGKKAMAGVYKLNAATYKNSNKALSSMNKAAYNKYASAADAASANKAAYKEARRKAKIKYRNSY